MKWYNNYYIHFNNCHNYKSFLECFGIYNNIQFKYTLLIRGGKMKNKIHFKAIVTE